MLANREELQAVAHERLGLVGAAFYQPGKMEIRPGYTIEVDEACLLLARECDGRMEITLANPENESGEVQVTVLAEGQPTSQRIVVVLPEGEQAGSSVTRTLRLL